MILVGRLPRWSFVGIALGVAASVTAADDPEPWHEGAHAPSGFTEEVVVIGTAIKGTPIDSPFAVTSMDRDRLEARGSPTWSDFFKKLGASRGVVGERSSAFNSNQFNIVASSVANVNLRGLGASRTLVLFNGRRQVYLPARLIGGRFVDVNAMPRIAVERVEVLKEGASALYGSGITWKPCGRPSARRAYAVPLPIRS